MSTRYTETFLKDMLAKAQAAAAQMVPGAVWLGGLPEARTAGYDDERDISLFCTLYLDALPKHSAVVTDQDGKFIRFE